MKKLIIAATLGLTATSGMAAAEDKPVIASIVFHGDQFMKSLQAGIARRRRKGRRRSPGNQHRRRPGKGNPGDRHLYRPQGQRDRHRAGNRPRTPLRPSSGPVTPALSSSPSMAA